MEPRLGFTLLLFTIVTPLLPIFITPYNGLPQLLSGSFQSSMLAGGGIILLDTIIQGSYRTPAYLVGCVVISVISYRIFIYTSPFDRLYPENTLKILRDVPTSYIHSTVEVGLETAPKNPDSFAIELHGVKQKWFCVYEDKNEFSDNITNERSSPTKCWNCSKVKEDIRLEGVRISQYALKHSIIDSRDMDTGVGQASICYDCSMNIVKEIQDSEELDIDTTHLVAAGI